jgi:hypothetical protein
VATQTQIPGATGGVQTPAQKLAEGSSNNARERDGEPADSGSAGPNFLALLIDFDWPAKDGVGRYPATISTSEEVAPAVGPYGLMHKVNDLYCLDLLRQKCY